MRERKLIDASIGDTIAYHLTKADLPVDPNQLWYGRVKHVYQDKTNRIYAYDVESQEYPGSCEKVFVFQVTRVEPATAVSPAIEEPPVANS